MLCNFAPKNYNQHFNYMKHIILTLAAATFAMLSDAQVTQYVCPGQHKTYHVETVNQGSTYKWSINPAQAGKIIDGEDSGRITVEWNSEFSGNPNKIHQEYNEFGQMVLRYTERATLSVYEIDPSGCTSETGFINIEFAPAPSAEFDNTLICQGEPLNIVFSEKSNPPFKVVYTIDGEEETIEHISTKTLPVQNTQGVYKILSITDGNGCTTTPTSNAEAVIGTITKSPKIKME